MSPQHQPYFVVDAFTDEAFRGNPAAVVPMDAWPAERWMQSVAMEMNLSETAFLAPEADGWRLRWFTPTVEVDLCGHATLAAAVVLADLGHLRDGGSVRFHTRSGVLAVQRDGSRMVLDFPALGVTAREPPPGLLAALRVESPRFVGRSDFDLLVELGSAEAVRSLRPDLAALASVPCRGVIVTAAGDDGRFDFVSRFFAPAVGVPEDPVTGSAHCVLGPYWSAKLRRPRLTAFQASSRGGVIEVEPRGDRVLLGGTGVLVARGELFTRRR